MELVHVDTAARGLVVLVGLQPFLIIEQIEQLVRRLKLFVILGFKHCHDLLKRITSSPRQDRY